MLGALAIVLLAAPVTTPAPIDADRDLPLPPIVFEPLGYDPAPAPIPAQTPVVPPVVVVPPSAPELPAEEPLVQDAPRTSLFGALTWIEHGFGGVGLSVTPLAGAAAWLTTVSVDLAHDRWSGGVGLVSGGNDALGLTLVGARAGATLASIDVVTFTAGMFLGLGRANGTGVRAAESTSVVAWQPEVAARARLLPWLRANATLSYRMVNAGDWGGPAGDDMGGFGVGLGLDFGRYD